MLLGGDEFGRTQKGNNNTYCQDNELAWLNWDLHPDQKDFLVFVQRLITFRGQHPVFQRRDWFQGREIHGSGIHDISWFIPNGSEISDEDWQEAEAKSIGIFLNGEEIPSPDRRGNRIFDDSFVVLFNAQAEAQTFIIPKALRDDRQWQIVLDTKLSDGFVEAGTTVVGDAVVVGGRSLRLLWHAHP